MSTRRPGIDKFWYCGYSWIEMRRKLLRTAIGVFVSLMAGSAVTAWTALRAQKPMLRVRTIQEAVAQCRRGGVGLRRDDIEAVMGKPAREEAIAGMFGPAKRLWYQYPIAADWQPYVDLDERTGLSYAGDCRENGKSRYVVQLAPEQWARLPSSGVQQSPTRY